MKKSNFYVYNLNFFLLFIFSHGSLYSFAIANDDISFCFTNKSEKSFLIKGNVNNPNNIVIMSLRPDITTQKVISKPITPTDYIELEGYIFVIKTTIKKINVHGSLPKYLFNPRMFTSKNKKLNGWIVHIYITDEIQVFPIIWGAKSLGKKQIYNSLNIPDKFSALTVSCNRDLFENAINYIEVPESNAGAFFYIKNTSSCISYKYNNELLMINQH